MKGEGCGEGTVLDAGVLGRDWCEEDCGGSSGRDEGC